MAVTDRLSRHSNQRLYSHDIRYSSSAWYNIIFITTVDIMFGIFTERTQKKKRILFEKD